MSAYPKLNVKSIIKPILKNYNKHVQRFYKILQTIDCELYYDGPSDIHDHIRDKTVYACSIKFYNHSDVQKQPTTNGDNSAPHQWAKKFKILKSIFPVMIGSHLDTLIRKKNFTSFREADLDASANNTTTTLPFEPMDIASTFFIINGCVRQLPYFYTNDPTNTHIVRQSIVRCYTYDSDDKGKELSLYMHDDGGGGKQHKSGDLVVVLNDGTETNRVQGFFDHCRSHATDQRAYMSKVYLDRNFDIDHLGNKMIISPGHLFVKLFTKYLYKPLRDRQMETVKSKAAMIVKSIESGSLLHVLSRKTLYFKESKSGAKMLSSVPQENSRELGMHGEVYVERDIGCYRDISTQTYPLNPYLSHLIIRQISSKVKKGIVPAFNESYLGFFCLVGDMETKHIGRSNMMVRNTFVSTHDDLSPVYSYLNLIEEDRGELPRFFVVLNEACIPVTETCFREINLYALKCRFKYIECYREDNFVLIRYKMGLMFREIRIRDERRISNDDVGLWVTARDQLYWFRATRTSSNFTFHTLTSHLVDLNPFFHHNVFTKDILAFNILKNAVLATDPIYCEYFMETLSAYAKRTTRYHRTVCEPVDEFSSNFALRIPLVRIAYMNFRGMNQEDCIVVREDVDAFDSVRFHTVRLKLENPPCDKNSATNKWVTFHPKRGDTFLDDGYVGHIVCHHCPNPPSPAPRKAIKPFGVISLTTHAKLITVVEGKIYKLYFSKPNFRVVSYDLTRDRLSVCLKQDRALETGDKLCSVHGQKGVVYKYDRFPALGRDKRRPDIIVNPYCLFRMTCGQIREGVYWGGRDERLVWNSEGRRMPTLNGDGIFFSRAFYFLVAYWASEHFYAPQKVNMDLVFGQPVKGRSRNGGMRMGNMEINNGLRGNGLANCFEEKILEHGDRLFFGSNSSSSNNNNNNNSSSSRSNGSGNNSSMIAPLPKSTLLCIDDAKFFKCFINFRIEPCLKEIKSPTDDA